MISGYIGNSPVLNEAMIRFEFYYAEGTNKDFDLLKKAKAGKIEVAADSS